jgi:hypothetical protein
MTNRRGVGILALACAMAPFGLRADVLDSAADGFVVKETITIQAAPQEVYRRIFRVGEWWSPQHTFSGDAHNLSIEEKAGGCFCEKLPAGGSVKHLEVVYQAPGKSVVMHGTLGPLQTMAATGAMQIQLTAVDGGTKLEVSYAVAGYKVGGMNTLAPVIDSVLKEQFTRLKSYTEKNDPAPKN